MTGTRFTILISALAALAVGIGGAAVYVYATRGDSPAARPAASSPTAPAPAPPSKPAAKADPYEVYLKLAPAGAPSLSREDAQARAFLGCGRTWAPHTVDAALAEAYADVCKQPR